MTVKEAINKRYSTRHYEKNTEVEEEIIDQILEAGQKSPSGLASEPWQFYVLQGNLTEVYEACYAQEHVKDASFVIALVNYKKELIKDYPEVIEDKLKSLGEEKVKRYKESLLLKGTQYLREQVMFAASFMVMQATELGIGSVIVGGYDPNKMAKILNIDTKYYEVGLLISFGINAQKEQTIRKRRPKEEVIRKINL